MKRVIALVLLLSGVMTLFAFNVFAENSYVRYIRTYSGSISAASFTYKATACNFNFQSDTSLSGGIYQPVLISVNFRNNGSNDVKLANVNVELTFSSIATIQGYENYTSDLYVVVDGTTGSHTPTYKIFASNEYSYTNGFVIPALSNMTLVFEVDVASSINTSSGQPEGPYIDAIAVTGVTDYYSTGDYITGIVPNKLDEIETLIGYLATNQTVNTFYSDVHTLLTDIKNQISYSGTYVIPSYASFYNYSKAYTEDLNNFTITTFVYKLGSYLSNDEIEIINGDDYHTATKVIPIQVGVRFINNLSKAIKINDYRFSIEFNLPKTAGYSYELDNVSLSPIFDNISLTFTSSLNPTVRMQYKIRDNVAFYNTDTAYIPSGTYYLTFIIKAYVPMDADISVGSTSFINYPDSYTFTVTDTNVYTSEQFLLNQMYNSMNSSNSNGISNDSSTLKTESDTAHQQEQSYFAQNSQAIQATGLSNYRFDTVQQNGINAVSIDFTSLWNAIGSWNSVYIFSLTFGLALTILRHAPNPISSTRRKREWHNSSSQ